MSELSNVFRMLHLLRSGNLVKRKELAQRLDVSEKQVGRYKEIINELFPIESSTGPNGGYKLISNIFPFKNILSREEISELKYAVNSLSYNKENEVLNKAIKKITYYLDDEEEKEDNETIIFYSNVGNLNPNLRKINSDFKIAIKNNYKIKVTYENNSGTITNRYIEPYKLFIYKGESYLLAYCLKREKIRFFKLVRIKEYILTSMKFNPRIEGNKELQKYKENNIGIFYGDEYELELIIIPPLVNVIKERIWIENQKIKELNDGKILFKARIKDTPEVISWLLSMGKYVRIIKPEIIKLELEGILKDMIQNLK